MKIIGLLGAAGIVGGGFYIHGPIGGGEIYPVAAETAIARVQSVPLHGFVEGMLDAAGGSGGGGEIERAVVPGRKVIFTFKVHGQKVGAYTVEVEPVDAGSSRISADFEMTADAEDHMKGVMMPMAKQFAIVGKAMVTESVDAALDNRAYDERVSRDAMMTYAAANPGEIMKGASDAMDKAVAELKDRDRRNPSYSYGKGPQPTFVPGQPMVNPNPNGR